MSDSIVIIPTYNEKENIENIIRVVFGLEKEFHILIIDVYKRQPYIIIYVLYFIFSQLILIVTDVYKRQV